MPRKFVITSNIVGALQQQFQQKSYLGHLSSTKTFLESSKLAMVSTAFRECLEFLSKMTMSQAKQFEIVAELINIYVYHLNLAHKENMHATVSTPLCECLEFLSKMTTSQAKQFEIVAELINIYVYHLNLAHKENMHKTFEMALYCSHLEMNKNDGLH
jgi:hypothetical protein